MDARPRIGGGTRVAIVALVVLGVPIELGLAAHTWWSSKDAESVVDAAPLKSVAQPSTSSASASTTVDAAAEVKTFTGLLDTFRAGDASCLVPLRASADRLAAQFGREDGHKVLDFYTTLEVADRKRGREAEIAYAVIWSKVDSAGKSDMTIADWRALRSKLLDELTAIIDQNEHAPDFTPAARSLALRAKLRQQRVTQDRELSDSTKVSWIQSAQNDADLALEMFERVGLLTPRLQALAVLADLAFAKDQWNEAEDGYEDVLQLARHVGRAEFETQALGGLLRLAQESGDLQRTSMLSNELAAVATPDKSWLLTKCHSEFLLSLDEPRCAQDFLIKNKPTTTRDLGEWHLLLGAAFVREGDLEKANAHFRAMLQDPDAEPVPGSDAWAADADRLLRAKKPAAAIARLDAVPDVDRLGLGLRSGVLRIRGQALLDLGDAKNAAIVLESALREGDSFDARLAGLASASSSVIGETIGLETVALLARARTELGDAFGAALVIENQQSRALRGAIAGSVPSTLTREDLIAWSNAFELGFVTWVIGADSSVVVYVARDGDAIAANVDVGRKQLEEAVRRLSEAAKTNSSECGALATQIQNVFFPAAILERMPATKATDGARLLVCAHGPMERMPFSVLPIFSGETARRIVPVVQPGILEHAPGATPMRSAFAEWSLIGNPVDADGATRLVGAQRELDALAAMYPTAHVVGARAFDEAALAEALSSKRALHIATHLRAQSESWGGRGAQLARAGFELSRSELSRDDLFDVDQIRRAHPTLPLAVLSACETGAGQFVDAEASVGVSRAFLESGTRNLLVTLWAVEDGAAHDYALAFHRALAAGQLPSRASIVARDELRARGAHMSEWAAFRVVGRD